MNARSLVAALALASGCGEARFDLGRVPLGVDGGAPDAGLPPDGGIPDAGACPAAAGAYTIDRAVGSCARPGEMVEVRQPACDLVFPGPVVEGTASFRTDGNWSSADLRVGSGMHSCIIAAFPADGLLQIGCGSVCNLTLSRGGPDGG